jgi:hypothetical protein
VGLHRELVGRTRAARLAVVSHDGVALGWLETRTPEDMAVYGGIMRAAHALLAEGLSETVITRASPRPRT